MEDGNAFYFASDSNTSSYPRGWLVIAFLFVVLDRVIISIGVFSDMQILISSYSFLPWYVHVDRNCVL